LAVFPYRIDEKRNGKKPKPQIDFTFQRKLISADAHTNDRLPSFYFVM
jgi:hypothetical protein